MKSSHFIPACILLALALTACGGAAPTAEPASVEAPPSDSNICLTLNVEHSGFIDTGALEQLVRRWMRLSGHEPSLDGECGADLAIDLTVDVDGRHYDSLTSGGEYCYTGARAEGELRFSQSGDTRTIELEARKDPPPLITNCPGEEDAPYDSAWGPAVFNGLTELWGVSFPTAFLDGQEQDLALEAIRRLGPEGALAIPDLITLLDGEGETLETLAALFPYLGEEALDAIIAALSHENAAIRAGAAYTLGRADGWIMYRSVTSDDGEVIFLERDMDWPTDGVVPALEALLEDDDPAVRQAAEEALENL
ncbi:MAG: HEAT repeat domain-containing protein [Anaerolineales bacterium]|nr:HEAT repeat domain-containing protein [Anaerolineales bacterium]